MNHTPGPWTVGPHRRIISSGWSIDIADTSSIAFVLGEKNPELAANARLMAAAPDLLEALNFMLRWGHCPAADNKAREAITKATGVKS